MFVKDCAFVTDNSKDTSLLQNLSIFNKLQICNALYHKLQKCLVIFMQNLATVITLRVRLLLIDIAADMC